MNRRVVAVAFGHGFSSYFSFCFMRDHLRRAGLAGADVFGALAKARAPVLLDS